MGGTSLSMRSVSLSYTGRGDERQVIQDVSLEFGRGEFICVVGPSGCGKTTLLRMVAGLVKPTSGGVSLNDVPVLAPNREVAVELSLSPNTIAWNLSKIYRKLGVRSRTELAAQISATPPT